MEHWLPLFLPGMETLLDYLPTALVSFDYQADEAIQARFDTIADFYQARAQMVRGGKGDGAAVYRPLAPDALYWGRTEFENALAQRPTLALSPFGRRARCRRAPRHRFRRGPRPARGQSL